ncbi:MAG: TonB-dependent receptor [Acidobacteriota bacterium]|nr:TonB-dependent receptor [Acidobacteriota bacterium]
MPCAVAQTTTGSISGKIMDVSGAAVANAKVVATELATNVSRDTTSSSDGSYSLLFLPVGSYRVDVTVTGFKKFEQTGIILELNRNAHVDAALQLGGVSETVEVKADAAMVETSNPALGLTVNSQDIELLPLVDRDVYSLLTLTAGVDLTTQATDSFGAPQQQTLINGSPNSSIGSVNYNLDGGVNSSGLRNTGNAIPNPDAVREFRVVTNSYSAEYGRFAGGVMDVVTKSGTNQLHGSLFEFVRNTHLNASRWVPGASTLRTDPLHRNQFGGSAGAPIKKDKTFIFGSYSGLRKRTTVFQNTATPLTAQERIGDLSATGGTAPVDPLTKLPFPGRIIPPDRIDPVVKKIIDQYLPLPNLAKGLYEVQIPHPNDTDELVLKVDQNLSASHRLTGALFFIKGSDLIGLLGNIPWVTRDFSYKQFNYNATDTWIISPTKINDFHAQYLRDFGGRVNLPAISLGDFGSTYNIQGPPSLPQIQVAGRFNLNSAIPGPVAGSNLYQIRDTFSLTVGRHSIKAGGEVILEKMIHDTSLNNYGTFSFTTNNALGTKNATADFLLGLPNTMNQDTPSTKVDNGWYYGLFLQDEFRIHPRLTLNLGLRYDLQMPITDTHNRLLTFVAGAQSVVVPTAPKGLLFPGDPGVGRGIFSADKNNLTPRVGIAWDPWGDRKTAIRAAFGIFTGSFSGNEVNTSSDNQPFAVRQQFNNVYSISDPYRLLPGGVSPFPYHYSPSAPKFIAPSAIAGMALGYRSPYSYQMNFSIQRQLTNSISVQAAYVSTLSHRLPVAVDHNYPVLTPGATTNNVDTRRPYQPLNTLGVIGMSEGLLNSAYHGLQLTGEKRAGHNFSVKGFYTFGKSLDYLDSQRSTSQVATDWNNIALDRGRTANDHRHAFVLSGIWRMDYFHDAPRLVRTVAGGWSLTAINTMRSGTPLTITAGIDRNFDGTNNDRPDLIGNPRLDPNRPRSQAVDQWFNTSAFTTVTQAKNNFDGTAGRGIVDGPGLKNVDMGIYRDFRIAENKTLTFRTEMSNALNLVNLSNPGTNANTASTFGRVSTAGPMRQIQLGLRLKF